MKNKTPEQIAREILRKNVVKATEVLVSLLQSKDESVRLQAAIAIIQWVIGMPIQPICHESRSNSSNS